MVFILLGIVYVLLIAFLVRFLQRVHQWDEDIRSMVINGEAFEEQVSKPKAA